ncbi:Bll6585 protein [alpha proteobacterium U9-1i]|nr:Bll6585 protein [alpha proteobacterium U9-1i]
MQALARRAAAPIFALALFSSAALIFVLQPLFGRMVTPLLGGSPAVWNASMAFFQGALLTGYLYAHLLARVKDLRVQAAIHAIVLACAWFALPVTVSEALGPPNSNHPALWLVGVLALSVGAPFAAASATAPLLQSWFARSGRADAGDPYYLYAASNLGSFAGLLAYPAFIEPMLGVAEQGAAWSAGYAVVAALIALCACFAIQANGGETQEHATEGEPGAAPNWRQRLYWLAAAAVPSALSLGVTLHITTDVASAPMLWVVPLALYLLTFVIAFARGGERIFAATLFVQPAAIAFLLACYVNSGNWGVSIAGILAGFFFSALVCHQALARTRPDAKHLTEFYLYVSLGGVLGGAFAAFVAPMIFNNVYEYPLALALACLFRPKGVSWMPRLADAAAAGAALLTLVALFSLRLTAIDTAAVAGAIGAAAALLAAGWGADEERPTPLRYAYLVCAALYAALVIYVVFNTGAIFQRVGAGDDALMAVQQPWGLAIIGLAFLTLAFVVHSTIQPEGKRNLVGDIANGVAMPTLLLMMVMAAGRDVDNNLLTAAGLTLAAIAILVNGARPLFMAALVILGFTIFFIDDVRGGRIITQERSFFGVLRTREIPYPMQEGAPPVSMRILLHGTTIHGAQLVGEGVSRTPLTYYNPRTALGEAIMAGLSTGDTSHLALIGLGAGSTACLTSAGDTLTIFEIDPAVVRLSARPGGDFTYVPECQPNARIELGDARLQIAEEPDGEYDVIVVDAFSSDAIPAHLLTREAIALYLSKTSDRGIVVLHLSNRNLALVSEAARVARDLRAPTLYRISDRVFEPGNPLPVGLAASVMIVARSPEILASLPLYERGEWRVFEAPAGRSWSDDYINMPRALWESLTGREECRIYTYLERCQAKAATD